MKKIMTGLLILGLAAGAVPAMAGPAADALSECMADNTSGRERKDLARWVFVGMSSHPEMRDLSVSTDEARDRVDRTMGQLVTKLLAESCLEQARAAVQQEGAVALQISFGMLGKLAMQELTSNEAVSGAMSGFEKYIDKGKMERAFSQQ